MKCQRGLHVSGLRVNLVFGRETEREEKKRKEVNSIFLLPTCGVRFRVRVNLSLSIIINRDDRENRREN